MTQPVRPSNDPEMWKTLIGFADVRLQAQLAAALAADQRAMVFAGMVTAAIAALAGGAAVVLTGTGVDQFLGYAAIFASLGLLIALGLVVFAARPVKWYYPGTMPCDWGRDFLSDREAVDMLREYCDDMTDRVKKNERTMSRNGKWLLASAITAFGTLALTTIIVAGYLVSK